MKLWKRISATLKKKYIYYHEVVISFLSHYDLVCHNVNFLFNNYDF